MGTVNKVEKPIIFFDGVCNLCNSSVQFIIKRDKSDTFRFSSLQSDLADKLLPNDLVNLGDLQSFVLLENEEIKTKSTAALTISKRLTGLWPVLSVFLLLPKFVRDSVYNVIAKNRYKWFGKKDECMIPTPEMKDKFLD